MDLIDPFAEFTDFANRRKADRAETEKDRETVIAEGVRLAHEVFAEMDPATREKLEARSAAEKAPLRLVWSNGMMVETL